MSKKLSKEAIEALTHMSKHPESKEWIARDAFRVWYEKLYWLDDGSVGKEIISKDFKIEEL
jgi:hypothetical protein